MRPLLTLLACALLAACAAPASVPVVARQNKETRALALAYSQSLQGDAQLAPLWAKTSLALNEMTPAMLADGARAAPAERPPLREFARRAVAYEARTVALFKEHGLDARLINQWQAGAQTIAQLRAQLHNGAITWGEYNTRVREVNGAQRIALADMADALAPKASATAVISARRSQQAAQETYLGALGAAVPTRANPAACERIGMAMFCQ